jgi:5-methyltetrahydropteroyltriglutamate--homocysteine methyltransferase
MNVNILLHNHSSLPGDLAASLHDLLRLQENLGYRVLTDGFFSARDPVWLAIECVHGVEAGEPTDYFGAGLEVPRPVVRDHIHYARSTAAAHWRDAQALTQLPVKAVLPGPFTLAYLSGPTTGTGPYPSREALAEAWATALLAEFTALVDAGAQWIQLEEPALLRAPEAIRLVRDLLEPFWASRDRCRLVVSTWGEGATALYAQLHSLPADVVGVDLVSNPDLLDLIPHVGASQELYLGLLRPETATLPLADEAHHLQRILHNYELESLHIGPACGLEAVPPATAQTALQQLAQLAALVGHSG